MSSSYTMALRPCMDPHIKAWAHGDIAYWTKSNNRQNTYACPFEPPSAIRAYANRVFDTLLLHGSQEDNKRTSSM
jgi:hypothetical protein